MKKHMQPIAAGVLGLAAAGLVICALVSAEAGRRSVPAETAAEGLTSTESAAVLCVNTADEEALAALPGIGEVLAGRITEYREEHGPFRTPEDLKAVNGIGDALTEKLAPLINFEDGE